MDALTTYINVIKYIIAVTLVLHSQTAIFLLYWAGKNRVWYIDTISVQSSALSRVGDDWC